jgi:sterol desaturase/sphingolipid hydroxylase (fatty acid hydroxylase superfamily)
VHKPHHLSTSIHVMTAISISPVESLINGGFVPVFLMLVSVDDATQHMRSLP